MPTYSFQDVVATITGPGGVISMGAGAGVSEEGITVEYTEEKNTQTIGADGQPMNSLHASNAGRMSIRLLKTSPQNALLSQMFDTQKQSSALWGNNVLLVSDVARGDVCSGQYVAFARKPVVTYSKDGSMNEWLFHVGILEILLGSGAPTFDLITG